MQYLTWLIYVILEHIKHQHFYFYLFVFFLPIIIQMIWNVECFRLGKKNSASCESIAMTRKQKHVQLYRHCLFQYIAVTLHRLMPSHLTQRTGMHFMVVFSSQLPFWDVWTCFMAYISVISGKLAQNLGSISKYKICSHKISKMVNCFGVSYKIPVWYHVL